MIVSLKELNKFLPKIQLDLSIEKIINNLGYEVESITKFSDVKGIKFSKVLNVYKNPNSKKLNVVDLQTNKGNITIQTVANNVKKGYFTVAFVENSKANGIVYSSKEIAGIASQGMLSGYSELGFNQSLMPIDKDDLIMIKDKEITLDTDPIKYFELDDYILDITTPSNRADINSYYVLALEIAAYLNTEFKWFNLDIRKEAKLISKLQVDKKEAEELTFLEVELVNKETRLKDMLFLVKHNIEAKNNWAIDITNLNLILNGTPTHAYDKNKIGNKLKCEFFDGQLNILGNKEVILDNSLVISDENKPISIASVMGLEQTAVDNSSQKIVLEIGSFNPRIIRKTAKNIKLESQSSIQGSRGINYQMIINGMKFLIYKANEDKQFFSNAINLPRKKANNYVNISKHKLATYTNLSIKNLSIFSEVEKKLKYLGFKMDKNRVTIPSYRSDISCYEDVIEEYFRFYGYDKFIPKAPFLLNNKIIPKTITKEKISSQGYQEVRTFTLTSEKNKKFNFLNFNNTVKLKTFVSLEREIIRNSIIPSLLEVAEYNDKRKIKNFSIFEHGLINKETFVYGLLSTTKTFEQMKQDIINLIGDDSIDFKPFKNNEFVHPNVSAQIYKNNVLIGWLGKINPRYTSLNCFVAEFENLEKENDYFTLNGEKNNNSEIKNKFLFKEYDSSPLKTTDITFSLKNEEIIGKKINELKENYEIFDCRIIDVYNLENTKNITIRITAKNNVINQINDSFHNKGE
ncbi:phenylalanine--tRNA ligase subunit beta [Mycoplasmopsis meleagridis]|uniref:phenylalanine--tRNA ligase subunit beta n=1 Tax=Mycoplasmopsis meleagridis TaxID=29561 RepID=UPI00073D297A|nr:phenylalanine--tRNA ligase subunit beta [Mycoplasmopsis meleagridis]KUH47657.1 phenylalanine--tRNA ligase subunit beta [Mycoplasmopsis meleagridis]